jgi:hypothetical protein
MSMSGLAFALLSNDPKGMRVTSTKPLGGELMIPSKVSFQGNEYSVCEIQSDAFVEASFTKVGFPSTLRLIGMSAFAGNVYLAAIAFEANSDVAVISDLAFTRCPSLMTVDFSSMIILQVIGKSSFRFCNLSGRIELPTTLVVIGPLAFANNWDLAAVVFEPPSLLVWIGDGCFVGTAIREIEIPLSLQIISPRAFLETTALVTCRFTFGHNIHSFGVDVFKSSVLEEITIPDAVLTIEAGAFEDAENLKKVNFSPNSRLQRVDRKAFACTSITVICLPATLVELGSEVFLGCKQLLVIEFATDSHLRELRAKAFIGANVKILILPAIRAISPNAFDGLDDLVDVQFRRAAGKVFELPSHPFRPIRKWYPALTSRLTFRHTKRKPTPD